MKLFLSLFTTADGLIALAATLVALALALGFHLFFRRMLAQSALNEQIPPPPAPPRPTPD